jgi:hypothetical protein
MENCKATSTPLATTDRLSRETGTTLGTEDSWILSGIEVLLADYSI